MDADRRHACLVHTCMPTPGAGAGLPTPGAGAGLYGRIAGRTAPPPPENRPPRSATPNRLGPYQRCGEAVFWVPSALEKSVPWSPFLPRPPQGTSVGMVASVAPFGAGCPAISPGTPRTRCGSPRPIWSLPIQPFSRATFLTAPSGPTALALTGNPGVAPALGPVTSPRPPNPAVY